jgi:uncharacterized protein (TIGR02217 family)
MAGGPPIYPARSGVVLRPDLADDPDIFPYLRGQTFPKKAPTWSTTVIKSKSGRRFGKQNWSYPTWVFSLTYASLAQKPTRMDLDRIWEFFNAHAGQLSPWYFYDPTDNEVEGQTLGTGDGVTTEFEIIRSFRGMWSEPIFALNGVPTVTVNGVPVTTFSIPSPGVLKFNSAPGNGAVVAWSGSFLFRCVFTQDAFTAQQLNSLLWSNDGLAFETLKS